jgi:hypothetical protein
LTIADECHNSRPDPFLTLFLFCHRAVETGHLRALQNQPLQGAVFISGSLIQASDFCNNLTPASELSLFVNPTLENFMARQRLRRLLGAIPLFQAQVHLTISAQLQKMATVLYHGTRADQGGSSENVK